MASKLPSGNLIHRLWQVRQIVSLNGLELISKIREVCTNQKILAFSGGGEAGSAVVAGLALDQALNEGACSAITKPFTEEQLIEKVRLILR